MLTGEQVAEFTQKFDDQLTEDISEPLFTAWLVLKKATIPTESESFSRVLQSHTANNVPKRANKRKSNLPVGLARYNPASEEWVKILEQQQENAAKKKITTAKKTKDTTAKKAKKTPPKQPKKVPPTKTKKAPRF